ncbi:uncharacterized protein LOC131942657 [Physella acuta]|uniref:uncharacterized protein LOC131942657 n=1 Tax=Physella acuta TaxID=109671 RepID=UPI0027DBC26C|nr:uncharacterized protein LOC131942657 [Physella acuta]
MNTVLYYKIKYWFIGCVFAACNFILYDDYLGPRPEFKSFPVRRDKTNNTSLYSYYWVYSKHRYPTPNMTQVSIDWEHQRRTIEKVCSTIQDSNTNHSARGILAWQIMYCPVGGAASTFLKKMMYQIKKTDPFRSPFEIPSKFIRECPKCFNYVDLYNNTQFATPGEKIKNLMFVRDPWSRLFSAYVDKLYSPNPRYWTKWGVPAVKKFRQNPSELSLRCGHDVTFSEFLLHHLSPGQGQMDADLLPAVDLCRPCTVPYDYIGHTTVFERDLSYVFTNWLDGKTSQTGLHTLAEDFVINEIEDSVLSPFQEWSEAITQCMSKLSAARRIWRRLQFRGIISTNLSFPSNITQQVIQDMNAYDFIDILTSAAQKSRAYQNLRQQKRKVYTKAYMSISSSLMNRINQVYDLDFKMFNFRRWPRERLAKQNIFEV